MSRARDVADVQDNLGGAVPPFVAGKNKIINGDFGVWQRGTSFTNLQGFFADRFQTVPSGSVTSMTTSQQTFTPGAAPVAGYEGAFFARNTITTVGALTTLDIQQRVENVRTFAGQTVTLSFWAKGDSSRSSIVYLTQNFGSGGSSETYTSTPTLSITTSWVRYSFTLSVASISGKTIGTNHYLAIGIRQAVAAGSVLDIWGVQVEAGSVATPFTTATGTIQGELAACQRYYWRNNWDAQALYGIFGQGSATSTTAAVIYSNFPVPMRVKPTAIDFPTVGTFFNAIDANSSGAALTALGFDSAQCTSTTGLLNATVASGLTQFRPYVIRGNNSTGAYIGWSAEL
jgi:hypothetical protein